MKRAILLFLFGILFTQAFSQWAIPKQMRAENTLDRLSDRNGLGSNDLLYGLPPSPGGVKGSFYLNDHWNIANIMLVDSEKLLEGYAVKYNLKDEELEVRSKTGIKILDAKKIKSLVWKDSLTQSVRYFVNAGDYTEEGTPLRGLLEVVADGKMPLLKRTYTSLQDPTYIPAFDVGSRDAKILKKTAFYHASGNALTKVTNKKNLLASFGDQAADMEKYMKINQLSVNKEQGLMRIFEYYNSKFKE